MNESSSHLPARKPGGNSDKSRAGIERRTPINRERFIGVRCSVSSCSLWFAALSLAASVASAAIPLPNINTNNVVTITNAPYNAVGNGIITNTAAIQSAINAAAAGGTTNGLIGGTVRVPAGTFLTGPLTLANNVNLQLDGGAILQALPLNKYPGGTNSPAHLITANSKTNIAITGTGAIDGQGAPWWDALEINSGISRPLLVSFQPATKILVQDVTFSNAPAQNLVIKGKGGNVTIQRVIFRAPSSGDALTPSHNTDAIDLAETNVVIQNCDISVGDDNVAVGSSGGFSGDILITNLTCGFGHGISIGSFTSSGVSNMTVIDCTFTNTDQGIRIKSDRDRGGIVQKISYLNLTMSNVQYPILIYCSYTNTVSIYKSINNLTPAIVATYPSNAVTSKTPIYRNITISNVTGTAQSGRMAGLIWGLPEMLITNLTLNKVQITGSKTFGIYYASGIQFVDSQIITPGGVTNISFYNAKIIFTNSTATANTTTLDGISTNGISNTLLFYNAKASLKNTNAIAGSPGLTLSASTLTIGNHLRLDGTTPLNFVLGNSNATIAVANSLALDGAINVSAGAGFTNGSYTLFTYGSTLEWGPPSPGSQPAGFNYTFDTNTPGQVNLLVQLPPPAAPTNFTAAPTNALVKLSWSTSSNATSYNLKRTTTSGGPYTIIAPGLTATNFNDADVTNGVTYFYVVSALNGGSESTNSVQISATPSPSLSPVSLTIQNDSEQLNLSWPADHTGWRLEIQTNSLDTGLGDHWITVPDSTGTNQISIPVVATNPAVFLRLTYP